MALLKAGADPAAADAVGATPRDLAAAAGHDRLLELLPAAAEVPRRGSGPGQGTDPASMPSARGEAAIGVAGLPAGADVLGSAAEAAAAATDEGLAPCSNQKGLASSLAGEAAPTKTTPKAPLPRECGPASARGGAAVEHLDDREPSGPGTVPRAGGHFSPSPLAGARRSPASPAGSARGLARHPGAEQPDQASPSYDAPDQALAEDDDAALVDALAAECTARQAAVAALAAEREGRAADAQARTYHDFNSRLHTWRLYSPALIK